MRAFALHDSEERTRREDDRLWNECLAEESAKEAARQRAEARAWERNKSAQEDDDRRDRRNIRLLLAWYVFLVLFGIFMGPLRPWWR